jgi:putative SOS response-associated peptidase YedK
MCNAYRVKPKRSESGLEAAVSDEIERLPSSLVRRTGRGVVVTMEGGEMRPASMRWGFHRPFSDAINNARSDKFSSPVWKESLAHRRCLVPISAFYEWQPLPNRKKQAFEFRRADGEWMWIAGIFESSEKYGLCYSTITTEPPGWMEPIHDRMLAVLDFEVATAFLRGETLPFAPYAGNLIAEPCESPLKQTSPAAQGVLF